MWAKCWALEGDQTCYQLKIDCYIYVVICKPHGKHKVKSPGEYTKERNISIPLKKVIKSQRKRAREERAREKLQKQPENNEQNGIMYITINNYLKCK